MRLEVTQVLKDAADEIGLELSLNENYSGRGMIGQTTAAVICASWQALLQVVAIASIRVYEVDCAQDRVLVDHETFIAELGRQLRSDSMGRDLVVY